jgi:hypothetical protein
VDRLRSTATLPAIHRMSLVACGPATACNARVRPSPSTPSRNFTITSPGT